jgi:A/G-specific adenine glycosylase
MAGHSRPKDGVASARLCPGHPRLPCYFKKQDVDARHKAGHDGAKYSKLLIGGSLSHFI